MPAAGSKGAPKNPRELKDDTSSSREEKLVTVAVHVTKVNYAEHISLALSQMVLNSVLIFWFP